MNAVLERPSIVLSQVEIVAITGYRQPTRQLAELHSRGPDSRLCAPEKGAQDRRRAMSGVRLSARLGGWWFGPLDDRTQPL